MTRYGFVFDQNTCTGCQACRLACTIENDLPFMQSWRQVSTFNPRHRPGLPLFHLSLACNHCADAACMSACPALAYERDSETGTVLLDEAKCIGCRYCAWACPFDAPLFDRARGIVTKCTFCVDRLKRGAEPACAAYCPTGALRVRRLPEEEFANDGPGFPQTDLRPAIRIVPLAQGTNAPSMASAAPVSHSRWTERAPSKITLRSEWSLVAFSFLITVLVAAVISASAGGLGVGVPVFVGTAIVALALATAHLGRADRAWRAVLNVKNSWLSREVVAVSLFVAIGTVYLQWLRGNAVMGLLASLAGFAALVSIDRVYRYGLLPKGGVPHSAGATLTGLFLAGVLAVNPVVAGAVGVTKFVLYMRRKAASAEHASPSRVLVSGLRLGLGLVAPALLWVFPSAGGHWVVIASVLLGELIDRCEFYDELEIVTPARQMLQDLERQEVG